jgi:hypothetical protein
MIALVVVILKSYPGLLKPLVTRQRKSRRPLGEVALLIAKNEEDVESLGRFSDSPARSWRLTKHGGWEIVRTKADKRSR